MPPNVSLNQVRILRKTSVWKVVFTNMFLVISDSVKIRIPLQIDSLAVLHKNTKALGLYDILIESVCRSIRLIEKSVANQKFLSYINDVGVPKTFNFKPKELGHFFSCVYLTKSVDEGIVYEEE